MAQRVRNAISKLDEKSQKVVRLRYYRDMDYQDIADELDLTLENVKIRLFRSKEKMKKYVKR